MFAEKDYIVVCHGCGNFHIVRSAFLSAPRAMIFDPDESGKRWCVPNYACPDCRAHDKGKLREETRIGRAYDKGMTPEALANAVSQFNLEWRQKLEAAYSTRLG